MKAKDSNLRICYIREDKSRHVLRRGDEERVFVYHARTNGHPEWVVEGKQFGCTPTGLHHLGWRYDREVEDTE